MARRLQEEEGGARRTRSGGVKRRPVCLEKLLFLLFADIYQLFGSGEGDGLNHPSLCLFYGGGVDHITHFSIAHSYLIKIY